MEHSKPAKGPSRRKSWQRPLIFKRACHNLCNIRKAFQSNIFWIKITITGVFGMSSVSYSVPVKTGRILNVFGWHVTGQSELQGFAGWPSSRWTQKVALIIWGRGGRLNVPGQMRHSEGNSESRRILHLFELSLLMRHSDKIANVEE